MEAELILIKSSRVPRVLVISLTVVDLRCYTIYSLFAEARISFDEQSTLGQTISTSLSGSHRF